MTTKPAQLKISFEGYNFNRTDTIKVLYINSTTSRPVNEKRYQATSLISLYQDFVISDSMYVTISNSRLLIADTLSDFKTEEKTISGGCPGLKQGLLGFEYKGIKYGPAEGVVLTIKR